MYRLLIKFGFLYSILKYFYKILNIKSFRKVLSQGDILHISIDGYKNVFCGYYDSSPFNSINSNLLLLHANNVSPKIKPSVNYCTDILLYDMNSRQYTHIDSTYCWNWQQGARLCWIDEDRLIYNFLDEKNSKLCSKIYNIRNKEFVLLPVSFNQIFKDKYVINLDYFALSQYSEYGYFGLYENEHSDKMVSIYSFENNKGTNLFSVEDIMNILKDAEHNHLSKAHVNHISISPDGKSFVFIFRGYHGKNRIDYLFMYSFITDKLSLILSNSTISHYNWMSNSNLLLWGVIVGESGYFQINVLEKKYNLLIKSNYDGHPTMLDNRFFITDTYPDKHSLQKLLIYDIDEKTSKILLDSYHPILYNINCRCDLHPSVDIKKTRFQIDSRFRGNRSVIIGDIPL